MSTTPMLDVQGLRKSYGATLALDGIDLSVERGAILALLGPNGAGKTSLVSIVAGLRRADAGLVLVDGIDTARSPKEVRRRIGLAPQETGVYPAISVRDNLRYFAGLAGIPRRDIPGRIDEVAGALGLTELLSRRGADLSGGERRRLHTAMALVHHPPLVLLDEPTTGADVRTRNEILTLVRQLADEGSTVVYSTHYLGEVEALDASVAIIDQGRVAARGSLDDLMAAHATSALELTFAGPVPDMLRTDGAVVEGSTVRITTPHPAAAAAELLPRLPGGGTTLSSIDVIHPTLETVFLEVTGHRYTAEAAEAAA